MNICFIIIIILELFLIGFFVYRSIRSKIIFNKSNFIYFLPVFLIMAVLYNLGYYYHHNTIDFWIVAQCLLKAAKSFSGDVDLDYVNTALSGSLAFAIAFYTAYILAVFTLFSSLFSLVSYRVSNFFRLRKTINNTCDIVIGSDEDAMTYFKNSPRTILWIEKKLSSIERQELFVKKVPYINKKFDEENLEAIEFSLKNEYHFITLEKNSAKKVLQLNTFMAGVKTLTQNIINQVYFHLELDQDNYMSLRKVISSKNHSNLNILCFNRHNLLARNFIKNHPMTERLTEKEMDYNLAVLRSNSSINCIYLGFGRVNEEMYKCSVINNQFVTLDKNNHLTPGLINYHVFDHKKEKETNKNLIHINRMISDYNETDYFEKPYETHNFHFYNADINESKFYQELLGLIKDNNSFSYLIVSIGTDLDNLDLAQKILDFINENNIDKRYHLYVRIANEEVMNSRLILDEHVTYFGNLSAILSHDIIVGDKLSSLSVQRNELYKTKKKTLQKLEAEKSKKTDYRQLSFIKQLSNEYSTLGIRFKLQCLGLDYGDSKDVDGLSLEQYLNIYLSGKEEVYANGKFDYSLQNIYHDKNNKYVLRDVMAYQEHLRWCAFYRINGYIPMKKQDIVVKDNPISSINQNNSLRTHACLTTFEGLNDYHHYLVETYSSQYQTKKSKEEILKSFDTYLYDYQVMDQVYELLKAEKINIYHRKLK